MQYNVPHVPTSEFDMALQAMLGPTNDPNIFEVNRDYAWPAGVENYEFEMGQQPMALSFDPGFDFSFMSDIDPTFLLNQPTYQPAPLGEDPSANYNNSYQGSEPYADPGTAGGELFNQYVDYEGNAAQSTSSFPADTISPTDTAGSAAPQHAPYVPPAGAQYSSTRRVGGSWQRSFAAAESPIEVHSPHAYGLRATS